jgi:hypothetical protein
VGSIDLNLNTVPVTYRANADLARQRSLEIALRADEIRRERRRIGMFDLAQILDFSGETLKLRPA